MSTGFLILKPKIGDNKKASEDAKVSIDQENNCSKPPATGSKRCATSSTTTKPKNTERGEAKEAMPLTFLGIQLREAIQVG
ncbi:hypothetical protein Pyn_03854 [Prunus yedoensis var. nudiflora]|uniref:Uncharacterized protein n=1 Tax=Prunus yedoensis var. nudiflora TaxID=2094558 RepID=A0A314UYS6_PRUYE|nr:hypothetical protein Pyn_03854 [Prunus yedoensis var. nudiflora]